MIPILYEANETAFTSNGLGRLWDCTRCECTEERNGVYEVEFDYPVTGSHYSDITLGRTIAVEHDQTGDIQPFDIYACDRPIDGVVTFYAHHVSYRLNGIICLAPIGTNTLQNAFNEFEHAAGNADSGNFRYQTDFSLTEQRYMPVFDSVPRPVRGLLGGTEGSILDTFGGEFLFDKFTVGLFRKRGIEQDFTIRYGVNMTDYNESLDLSESYSWVWAYYKNGDDIAVSGALDSGYTALGGRHVGAVLDVTDKFENLPTLAQLQNEARIFLNANQPWLPKQTIEVEFSQEALGEYAGLHKCNLCDTVKVVFPRYKMEGTFKVVKTVWNVLLDRYEEMELGTLSTTLSEALGISSGSGSSGSSFASGPAIEMGTITGSSISANRTADYTVTFTEPFSSPPVVVACFQSTSTAGYFGRCTVGVVSTTATGCTIRVFNGDSSARGPNINWIAIGN